MKILQVINRLNRGGGAEKLALDLTLALKKYRQNEVSMLNLCTPKDNDFVELLLSNNIPVYTVSNRLRSITTLFKFFGFIRHHQFKAINVHLFPSLYFVGLAKMLGFIKCPIFYTEHSTKNRRRNSAIMRYADKIIYKQYSKIIAISDQVAENLKNHLGSDNIVIINNGIDIEAINTCQALDLHKEFCTDDSVRFVVMVARFMPGKDYATLYRSLLRLPESVHVVCVGDGALFDDAKQMVSKLSLNDRVHFTGLRTDVISIIKGADIAVLSTEHEGFSISMLEAMACGKPFVASAVEGVKDLVDGVAELFEYQNETQLSDIIIKLLDNESYRNIVIERCSSFAANYDIKKIADKYQNIYDIVTH